MELSDIKVPKTFEEADSSIHKQHWRGYFHKEIFPILVDTHCNQCADGVDLLG